MPVYICNSGLFTRVSVNKYPFNPYAANVENMVSQQMAYGI